MRAAAELIARIADGRTDLVFELVGRGLPPATADERGVPLIRWCAYFGDVSAIRFLLGRGVDLTALGPNFDLNGAAFHGHWRLCQFLLELGADANLGLPESAETPLHAALTKANRPATDLVVAVLLAAGADPNRRTIPAMPTGSFMRDSGTRGETPLHRAAAFGSESTIAALLARGASLEARDANGDTPLAWASWHLRPPAILRKLCFGEFSIHPDAEWSGDHGRGWTGLDAHLLGKPHP